MSAEDHLIAGMPRRLPLVRKSALEEAQEVLGRLFSVHPNGFFMLRCKGEWVAASLDQVMRAANELLAAGGKPQIKGNPKWAVVVPPANSNVIDGAVYARE